VPPGGIHNGTIINEDYSKDIAIYQIDLAPNPPVDLGKTKHP
jgi:hypothetical protein